jgi:glucokinase
VNLLTAIAEVDGVPAPTLDAPQIAAAAQSGADPLSAATVDIFLALLGSVAGNLALTLGARGGVYLGGGIVPRFDRALVERSRFRERFEAKGRFRDYLTAIPTFVIDAAVPPALIGASRALDRS